MVRNGNLKKPAKRVQKCEQKCKGKNKQLISVSENQ